MLDAIHSDNPCTERKREREREGEHECILHTVCMFNQWLEHSSCVGIASNHGAKRQRCKHTHTYFQSIYMTCSTASHIKFYWEREKKIIYNIQLISMQSKHIRLLKRVNVYVHRYLNNSKYIWRPGSTSRPMPNWPNADACCGACGLFSYHKRFSENGYLAIDSFVCVNIKFFWLLAHSGMNGYWPSLIWPIVLPKSVAVSNLPLKMRRSNLIFGYDSVPVMISTWKQWDFVHSIQIHPISWSNVNLYANHLLNPTGSSTNALSLPQKPIQG